MPAFGKYEVILQKALEHGRPGPWDLDDFHRAEDLLTGEFCYTIGGECDKDAVLDWLSTLSERDVYDLIGRFNTTLPWPGRPRQSLLLGRTDEQKASSIMSGLSFPGEAGPLRVAEWQLLASALDAAI